MDIAEFQEHLSKFPVVRPRDYVLPPQAAPKGILDMFSGNQTPQASLPSQPSTSLKLPSEQEYAASRAGSSVKDPVDAAIMSWCKAAGLPTTKAAEVTREFRAVLGAVGATLGVEDAEQLAKSLLAAQA